MLMFIREVRWWKCGQVVLAVLALGLVAGHAATSPKRTCSRVIIEGEVHSGQEWKTGLGQGWVFRILPIAAPQPDYTGWDLVMDRQSSAGYPDALLLATLPYNSLNEREIGTTFGLRAQDAIGWNPRSFRFLTGADEFRRAQQLFREVVSSGFAPKPEGSSSQASNGDTTGRLLELVRPASIGELRILDARIVPGAADPLPYAQEWATASSRTPHDIEPASAGPPGALGKLVWMRFALTLWLPSPWTTPPQLHPQRVACPR